MINNKVKLFILKYSMSGYSLHHHWLCAGQRGSIYEACLSFVQNSMGYLKSKGLAPIEAIGKELDTDFHEAVAQFPVQEADKKNKVFDVTQQGYTLNGKVIRFAKVVVGI